MIALRRLPKNVVFEPHARTHARRNKHTRAREQHNLQINHAFGAYLKKRGDAGCVSTQKPGQNSLTDKTASLLEDSLFDHRERPLGFGGLRKTFFRLRKTFVYPKKAYSWKGGSILRVHSVVLRPVDFHRRFFVFSLRLLRPF